MAQPPTQAPTATPRPAPAKPSVAPKPAPPSKPVPIVTGQDVTEPIKGNTVKVTLKKWFKTVQIYFVYI